MKPIELAAGAQALSGNVGFYPRFFVGRINSGPRQPSTAGKLGDLAVPMRMEFYPKFPQKVVTGNIVVRFPEDFEEIFSHCPRPTLVFEKCVGACLGVFAPR